MHFEWDENKRLSNIEKHHIDFADAVRIFDGFVLTQLSSRTEHQELRYMSIGLLNGTEITVIHTPRDDKRRIISARRARIEERIKFYKERDKYGLDQLAETSEHD